MVSVLASSVVDRGFEPQTSQPKDYTIGVRCLSSMHEVVRRKSKGWLTRNYDNVSEWVDMSNHGLVFFQWTSIMKSY